MSRPPSSKAGPEPYKENFRHHSNRRKRGHDYQAPWRYHITISKAESASNFSDLDVQTLSPDGVFTELSPLGKIIEKEIQAFESHHYGIEISDYVIMPDHIHFLIQVKIRLAKPVGNAIGGLKTGIAQSWRETIGNKEAAIFSSGFNDRIIYSFRPLENVKRYIRQNPYRLAIRRFRPDFFSRSRLLEICGERMQGYGNLFLFRNPFKIALVIHRADSEETFRQKLEDCLYTVANGGVVVSAFISAREKEILKAVEAMGGRVIKIHHQPFAEKEKPALHDFTLCTEGRLLLLSPEKYSLIPKRDHPSREQCLEMNRLAFSLSGEPLS